MKETEAWVCLAEMPFDRRWRFTWHYQSPTYVSEIDQNPDDDTSVVAERVREIIRQHADRELKNITIVIIA